jgi:hypothetical protein
MVSPEYLIDRYGGTFIEMLIYIGIFVFAMVMGIINGLCFIYYDKLSRYLRDMGKSKKYYNHIHTVYSWSLIIVVTFTMFILPVMLISSITPSALSLKTRDIITDIYLYVGVPTFFITLFILIKIGILWPNRRPDS